MYRKTAEPKSRVEIYKRYFLLRKLESWYDGRVGDGDYRAAVEHTKNTDIYAPFLVYNGGVVEFYIKDRPLFVAGPVVYSIMLLTPIMLFGWVLWKGLNISNYLVIGVGLVGVISPLYYLLDCWVYRVKDTNQMREYRVRNTFLGYIGAFFGVLRESFVVDETIKEWGYPPRNEFDGRFL